MAVRIRVVSGRAIRTASRIAFFLCGLLSLFTGVPFVMLRGAELPLQGEWVVFVAILGLVGLVSVMLSVLSRSWIAKACGKDRDDEVLFRSPLKWLGGFAAVFYLVAVVAYLAPRNWNLDAQLMFSMCPLYFVKTMVDPSLATTFFLLAPMNAAVYGSLGLTLRYAAMAFSKRMSR